MTGGGHGNDEGRGNDEERGNDRGAGMRAQYSRGRPRRTPTMKMDNGLVLLLQQPSHLLDKCLHGKGFGEEGCTGRQLAVPQDIAVGIA